MDFSQLGELDQNQAMLFFSAIAAAILILLYFTWPIIEPRLFPPPPSEQILSLHAEISKNPFKSSYCEISIVPAYPDPDSPSLISLEAAFVITNDGQKKLSPPGKIVLVFENEIANSKYLQTDYSPGKVVFGSREDFSFTKVFDTIKYNSISSGVFTQNAAPNFHYSLIYCADNCTDPLSQGLAFYNSSTINCTRRV